MKRRLAGLIASLAVGALLLLPAACGGGDNSRVSIVFQPEEGAQVENIDQALDIAVDVLDKRLDAFGFGGNASRDGNQVVVHTSAYITTGDAADKLGRAGFLEFCEPVTDAAGNVAVVNGPGHVRYKPLTCEPERDAQGNVVVDGSGSVQFVPWAAGGMFGQANNPGGERIVWQPATAEIDGVLQALTGEFLKPNVSVITNSITDLPELLFEWTEAGAIISKDVTGRLAARNYPLAPFLDGEPVLDSSGLPIAPVVHGIIANQGLISGLAPGDAEYLSKLLNSGALPVPLKVVQPPA